MKDRIKKIRKDAIVTQEEFGKSIGLSRMMITQVETGVTNFSDRSIKDICRVYKVNEEWLRTGEGEPYSPRTKYQELAEFFNDVLEDDDEFKQNLIYALSTLDVEDWKKIQKFISTVANRKEE